MELSRNDAGKLAAAAGGADGQELGRGGAAPARLDGALHDAREAADGVGGRAAGGVPAGRARDRAARGRRAWASSGAEPRTLYQGLRPEALATALYIGAQVRALSGQAPLIVTSTVRDDAYQKRLVAPQRRGDPQLLPPHHRLGVRHRPQVPLQGATRRRSSSCSTACRCSTRSRGCASPERSTSPPRRRGRPCSRCSSEYNPADDRRHPHPRPDPRGAAGLPLRAALPHRRRAAPGPRRRGRRPSGGDVARRADLGLPVAPRAAAGARRRPPRDPARPRRLRALGQADRARLVLLRPPRRDGRHAARGPRRARRDVRRPRLGRADRAAARGRAPRPRRAARGHGHRPVHRRAADERRLARVPRLRRAHRGPADRHARAPRLPPRPRRRGRRRLRRPVPEHRRQGRRARVPAA